MTESSTPVNTYRINYICNKSWKCDHNMKYIPSMISYGTSFDTYTHKCPNCDHTIELDRRYPYIEYFDKD